MKLIAKIFEEQKGDALDVYDVQNIYLKTKSLDMVELNFTKNGESYTFCFYEVSNLSFELNKIETNTNSICIRNGVQILNFVLTNNESTLAFDFVSGTLKQHNTNSELYFDVK